MIRAFLLATALSASTLSAQETAAAATDAATAAAEPATDPLAAWEADPAAVIAAAGVNLAAFEFLARPLVVFADSPRDPRFVEQMRLLDADRAGLAARDVAVIVDTDPAAGSAVRAELRPRGFSLVLLDKDGRVGLRRPAPETAREITRAIDRMPLRQEEIRNQEAGEG